MSDLRLTCTRCRNTFEGGDDLHPGSPCPDCLRHTVMLPHNLDREGMGLVGTLILGVPVFETSEWADSTLCDVNDRHYPHTWEVDEQRFVCPGRRLDSRERTFHVLLTQGEKGLIKVAGISRQPEPIKETFETWHNEGRTLWLLTLTDPQEGLPGVKLELVTPKCEFSTLFVPSDTPEEAHDD